MQNYITSLAVISGNILRGIYFAEDLHLIISRQYQSELNTWTANLPYLIRQSVESGNIQNLPKDQTEAAVRFL